MGWRIRGSDDATDHGLKPRDRLMRRVLEFHNIVIIHILSYQRIDSPNSVFSVQNLLRIISHLKSPKKFLYFKQGKRRKSESYSVIFLLSPDSLNPNAKPNLAYNNTN